MFDINLFTLNEALFGNKICLKQLRTTMEQIQQNFKGSTPDGSSTTAVSNSF